MRAPTRLIDRVTIIEGELTAAVGELEFPASADQAAFAVWIFASEGIEAYGAPEVVVALARPDGRPAYPRFPFVVLREAYDRAAAGTPVQPGGRITCSEPGSLVAGAIITSHPFSDRRLRAAGVAHRSPFPLLAIPLLADELMAADVFGPARVLARCGEYARHYPYPWWFDRRSAPVLDLASDAEGTVLNRMPRQFALFAEVILIASQLEIIVPEDRCGELRDMLVDAPQAAALLPRLSHIADTLLVWRAGQDQPIAIVDAGGTQGALELGREMSVGGNFLAFVRGRERSEAVWVEDGFALLFPDAVWEQFVASVGACRRMRWRTQGETIQEASLRFTSTVHWSPLDEEFFSEGGFRTHAPKRSSPVRSRSSGTSKWRRPCCSSPPTRSRRRTRSKRSCT